MGLIDKAKAAIAGDPLTRSGKVDPTTGTHRATPWIEATEDALYTGLNRQVWMYRLLDNLPLRLADADELADHGRTLAQVLGDIGQTSIPAPPGFGVAPSGFYRNVHILVVRWYEQPEAPAGTPTRALADYLNRSALTFTSPRQAVFIGVQLRDLDAESAARNQNVLDFAKDLANTLFKDNPTDYDGRYAADRDYLHQAMSRNGCRIPTQAELRQLEAWFTHGSHTEPEIAAYPDHLLIGHDRERVEFAALERMNAKVHRAPNAEWIADLMEHSDGPSVISLRFELQPAVDVRKALRKSIRSRRNAEEEARKANQVDRVEETDEHQLTEYAETLYAHAGSAPSLHNVSVIFGRRDNGYVRESYDEYLRNNYHIDVKPLTHRQIQALEETQPCAQKRANPFPQQQTLEVVAYAGLGMFTELGDPEGAFIGRGLPDGTPVFFDPMAPARRNLPPATFISGVPGSGKLVVMSTKIPTPSGWTTMGEVSVGDEVVGRDGKPCRVTYLSPVNETPELYDVVLSDGQVVRACVDHQWVVSSKTARVQPGSPHRLAALGRWEVARAAADALEAAAGDVSPDAEATTAELLALVDGVAPASPWNTYISVYMALEDGGCPSRDAPVSVSVSGSPAVSKQVPTTVFPVAEVVSACVDVWARVTQVRWKRQAAERVEAAVSLLAGVGADEVDGITNIARRLMSAGAPTASPVKVFARQVADIAADACVEGRSGMAAVSSPEGSGYVQTKERKHWPVAVALKTLAERLRAQYGERPAESAEERVLTVGDMLAEGVWTSDGASNFAIRVTAPLDLPEADLPVDPYVLGAWLGDGSKGSGVIWAGTTAPCTDDAGVTDQQRMVDALVAAGYDASVSRSCPDRSIATRGLQTDLRAAGVLGRKHVPAAYLRSSYGQRLAVLQGLMDTDGTVDANGACELSLCDETLAADALELVRSLGIKASMTDSDATITEADPSRPGQKRRRVTGTRWRIHFTTTVPVFRLPRKVGRLPATVRETQGWLYVTDIVPVASEPGRCIQVDSPDHTYLVAGFVPTHNTWLSQVIAYQAVLAGYPVQLTNPKGQDSLFPFAYWLQQQGVDVEWVAISRLAQSGGEGTYDPWRYAATPETAAMIASNLITTVLDFDQSQRTALRSGLTRGAKAGARSSLQALDYVNDEYVVRQVMHMWESTPLFQLCLGMQPKARFDHASRQREQLLGQRPGKFVLTEFDVDLNLPGGIKDHYSDAERIGLSAVRAVTSASIGMLAGTTGGVYIVDEAHNVLGHPDTIGQIQKLMREGRSLGVSQIYISQLVSDLLQVGATGASLESYISRAFALKSTDDREAAAGLRLVGYEPTPERIEQMRDFGPKRTDAGTQPAYGYFRDLDGRKSIVSFGPYGEEFASAASTNIDDRRARELALDAGMEGQLA